MSDKAQIYEQLRMLLRDLRKDKESLRWMRNSHEARLRELDEEERKIDEAIEIIERELAESTDSSNTRMGDVN